MLFCFLTSKLFVVLGGFIILLGDRENFSPMIFSKIEFAQWCIKKYLFLHL